MSPKSGVEGFSMDPRTEEGRETLRKIEASTFTTAERLADRSAELLAQELPKEAAGQKIEGVVKERILRSKELTNTLLRTIAEEEPELNTTVVCGAVANILGLLTVSALRTEQRLYFQELLSSLLIQLKATTAILATETLLRALTGVEDPEFSAPDSELN